MKNLYRNIGFIFSLTFALMNSFNGYAQNNKNTLLVRDSLDYKEKEVAVNSKVNEFNVIPYKGGLLYVSNKKTKLNPLGFNKVYWVAKGDIGKISIDTFDTRKIKLNDDFTAYTSNDNNILTRYTSRKNKLALNAVEREFADFNPMQSFTIDSSNTIVYPKLSTKRISGARRWELWQAVLKNGRLHHEKRISIADSAADYLYPSLSNDGTKLYFSSNRKSGKGGFDVYYLSDSNGLWTKTPIAVDGINSEFNEIYPTAAVNELLYTSDRTGSLGGYDIYAYKMGANKSAHLGYPINTMNDDLGLAILADDYYLTTNKGGSLDIANLKYNPVIIAVQGTLNYTRDTSFAPGQKLYVRDNEDARLIDSIQTDSKGGYKFNARPNRNYTFSTTNADGIKEDIVLATSDKIVPQMSVKLNLKGRSPMQIKDSIQTVWVKQEIQRKDSIAAENFAQKFIVRYGFDKSILSVKEKLVLDSLLVKLNKLPNTYIVIGAFTDCIGTYKYNYKLSVKRAKFVMNHLVQHGLDKRRIISNGYSKKYAITACSTKYSKAKQQDSRRAEIVLSETKNTNWAILEKTRGDKFYAVYNSTGLQTPSKAIIAKSVQVVKPLNIKKDTIVVAKVKPVVVKKDTLVIAKVKPVAIKKDTVIMAKVKPVVVKKDTVVVTKVKPVVSKKDTILVAKVQPVVVKKDTVIIAKVKQLVIKKDTVVKLKPIVIKKDTILSALVSTNLTKKDKALKVNPLPVASLNIPTVIVAKSAEYDDAELSKAEIVKALDSLAKLRIEQERIVEYLTKRINKKPIEIFVSSDSVTIEIYDNAVHDKDSVSIIFNNKIIVDRQELKVNKPIKFKLKVDANKLKNELILVAENLGAEPPNTAVMFVTEKSGRRQQVMLSTDMTHNEVVYFIRIAKNL